MTQKKHMLQQRGLTLMQKKDHKAVHYDAGEIITDAPPTFDWEGLINVGAIEVVKGGK
jgi:CRP-like cAMP-binding protein